MCRNAFVAQHTTTLVIRASGAGLQRRPWVDRVFSNFLIKKTKFSLVVFCGQTGRGGGKGIFNEGYGGFPSLLRSIEFYFVHY